MVICKTISHDRLNKTIAHESCQINDQKRQDNSAYNRDISWAIFVKRVGYRTITKRNHPNGGGHLLQNCGPAPPEGFQGCLARVVISLGQDTKVVQPHYLQLHGPLYKQLRLEGKFVSMPGGIGFCIWNIDVHTRWGLDSCWRACHKWAWKSLLQKEASLPRKMSLTSFSPILLSFLLITTHHSNWTV